jgi:hypothetical protein
MTELLHEQPSMAEPAMPPTEPTPASVWVRFGVAVLLLAVVLASLGYLGWRVAHQSGGLGTRVGQTFNGTADDLPAQRAEVMSQARQFALRINTYGPDMLKGATMPAYRQQVDAVITPKLQAAFEKNAALADATVSQAGVKAAADVYATGVAALTGDSATALVAGSLSYSYPTKKGATTYTKPTSEPFRWEIELKQVDGAWLVDDFGPAESAQIGSSAGTTLGGQQ